MNTLVLLPLPDGRWLGLTPEALANAIAAADAVMPKAVSAPVSAKVELIDAATAAARFGIKKSWLLERARLNAIPHTRLGKYVRFDAATIAAHLARGTDQRLVKPHIASKPLNGKSL